MPCESAALSPSCSGTWMHVAQGGGAGGRPGLWASWATLLPEAPGRLCRGQPPNPRPKRPQLSSRAQRAAVCFLVWRWKHVLSRRRRAGGHRRVGQLRLRTCRRAGGSTISWMVTTSRTWIATHTVEGVRLEGGRLRLLHGQGY